MKKLLSTFSAMALLAGMLQGATVAEWDFDQDLSLAGLQLSESSPGTDVSGNGNTMLGYNTTSSAWYSSLGETSSGVGLSMEAEGGQDGYVINSNDGALRYWNPLTWTIEATVSVDGTSGWRTFIGKDGTSFSKAESDFYLQARGDTGEFRLLLSTTSGQRVEINSGVVLEANRWYQVAAVSDGTQVSFYVNDGDGYVLVGSEALTGATDDENRLSSGNDSGWTFLRGWWNGKLVDRVDGRIDNIRFSDAALSTDALIPMAHNKGTLILVSSVSAWILFFGAGLLRKEFLGNRARQ